MLEWNGMGWSKQRGGTVPVGCGEEVRTYLLASALPPWLH